MFGSFFDQELPINQFATPSAPISARIPQLSNVFSNSTWSQTILPSLLPSFQKTQNDPSFSLKEASLFNIHVLTRHGSFQKALANQASSLRLTAFALLSLCGLFLVYYSILWKTTQNDDQLGKRVSILVRKAVGFI